MIAMEEVGMCERRRQCAQCGRGMRGREPLFWGQCKRCLNRRRGIVAVNRSPVMADLEHQAARHREPEGTTDDMTEAELDAVIAEQMQCLPEWWSSEHERAYPL